MDNYDVMAGSCPGCEAADREIDILESRLEAADREALAAFDVDRARLATTDALAESLGALYAWEFEETDNLLASWKERFPNITWTKREIKLAAQVALREYEKAK